MNNDIKIGDLVEYSDNFKILRVKDKYRDKQGVVYGFSKDKKVAKVMWTTAPKAYTIACLYLKVIN